MYAYDGLNRKLEEAGMGKTRLSKELKISSRTIAKIARGEKLSSRVLQKISFARFLQIRCFSSCVKKRMHGFLAESIMSSKCA